MKTVPPWDAIYAARDALSSEIWRKEELLEKMDEDQYPYPYVQIVKEEQTSKLKALNKWLNEMEENLLREARAKKGTGSSGKE